MKIRLQSIEGRVGDPIYNEQQIERAIEEAKKDGVELLIFPQNSIDGVSVEELRNNDTYLEKLEEARVKYERFVSNQDGLKIVLIDGEEFELNKVRINFVNCYNNILDIKTLSKLERNIKILSEDTDDLWIQCQGNGNESVCDGVFSNVKIIAYKGNILASNLDTFSNRVDYDFESETLCSQTPYLDGIEDTDKMFEHILSLQAAGLYGKMKSMNRFKICMGVSGGLDSTVALLVCVEAFKKYGLPLKNIIGVTMPGLGTTERTYKNAMKLMKALGITIEEIDLRPLLKTHLKNISQPEGKFDVTFEQTQSRERTQVLLDIANRDNAIMIGTGCMSEFALGWMTYGGDHLSMFAINIGLPKTVVKMYARWFIDKYCPDKLFRTPELSDDDMKNIDLAATIQDILDGPVSPELLPIDDKGQQHEKTESLIGDYAVQDFFIYYMTTENISIKKLFRMACVTFPEYSHANILKWLEIFTLRYFTRAYKKNCYGDGLQIFDYSVSPKYFHIPSDIDYSIWKQEIEDLKKELGVE